MQDKYRVVLDTPVYRTVQELKTHLSDVSFVFLIYLLYKPLKHRGF